VWMAKFGAAYGVRTGIHVGVDVLVNKLPAKGRVASIEFGLLAGALFKINLSWAQALCIYMFVWMAKFGAAYGVRTGIHVGVDVLVNNLPEKLRLRFIMFGLLAGAFFTAVIGSFGVRFVWTLAHTDQTSPDLEMPMWIVYLAIPLGSYLMSFRFLQVAWTFWRTGELPHHDQLKVEGVEVPESANLTPQPAAEAR